MADMQDTQGRGIEVEQVLRGVVADMPEAARARIRESVLSAATAATSPGRAHALFVRAAAVFSALAISVGGVSFASASALPGSPLYPLKRAIEETQVALQLGRTSRADTLMEITHERVREVERLIESDAAEERIREAAEEFGDAAERAVSAEDDPVQSRERVSEIEDSVQEAPAQVRERVENEMPAPTPEPEPAPEPEPQPKQEPQQQQQQEPETDPPSGSGQDSEPAGGGTSGSDAGSDGGPLQPPSHAGSEPDPAGPGSNSP